MRVQCLKPQAMIIPVRIDKAELNQVEVANPHTGHTKQNHRTGNPRAEVRRALLKMQTELKFE